MSEPNDREKAAIRALYSGCVVREDMEALRGYVARVDRELNEWEQAGQFVVDLFDPLRPTTSPTVLRVAAQGAKHANKTMRARLADRGHTLECLSTYLDTFDPKCPTCNPKLPENTADTPRCAVCGGDRDTCGHFVGAGAL